MNNKDLEKQMLFNEYVKSYKVKFGDLVITNIKFDVDTRIVYYKTNDIVDFMYEAPFKTWLYVLSITNKMEIVKKHNIDRLKDLNNNINGKILEDLAESDYFEDKVFAAKHTNTYQKTLEKLMDDESFKVRYSVLLNPNICNSILKKMILIDKNEDLRLDITNMLKGGKRW